MASTTMIRKAYADSPHGQIHYRYTTPSPSLSPSSNTPKLPILFLHMSASSSACFEPLMATYTALGHPCYAPDMPGFGASFDPSPEPPDMQWYVDLYIATFFSTALFQNGCHVFGHHSGGCVAVQLAATHPNLVRSLAVAGPVLMDVDQRRAAREATQAFNQPVSDGSHLQETWDYLISHGNIDPQTELEVIQQETLDHLRAWKGRLQIYGCVFGDKSDGPTLYKSVTCPLITFCARDDVLWPTWEEKMEVLRPESEMVVVKGGNFEPSRDPRGIEQSYTPFLQSVEKA